MMKHVRFSTYLLWCTLWSYCWLVVSTANTVTSTEHPFLLIRKAALDSPACGTWQERFLQLQEQMLNNVSTNARSTDIISNSSRRLIFYTQGQGASDRLVGVFTGFYLALLSNRSFQVFTRPDTVPPFEVALQPSFVDWMVTPEEAGAIEYTIPRSDEINEVFKVQRGDGPTFEELSHHILPENILSSIPTVLYNSNRGLVYKLFHFAPYSTILQSTYGIKPRMALHCAFHHLFRPSEEVLATALPYSKVLYESTAVKIGIQVRTGDSHFNDKPDFATVQLFRPFFLCAERITNMVLSINNATSVLWYLISDSQSLKRSAVATYGQKVQIVTNVNDTVIHVGQLKGNASERMSKGRVGMQHIVAELLSFAMCDFFVVSDHSGVGKLGAWLSSNRTMQSTYSGRYCHAGALSDRHMAESWAGI